MSCHHVHVLALLHRDGSILDGPALTNYYTAAPAIDRDCTTVFWRDGALRTIDANLSEQACQRAKHRPVLMSRVLLLDDGISVFALDNELLFFSPDLASLDGGIWLCREGTSAATRSSNRDSCRQERGVKMRCNAMSSSGTEARDAQHVPLVGMTAGLLARMRLTGCHGRHFDVAATDLGEIGPRKSVVNPKYCEALCERVAKRATA